MANGDKAAARGLSVWGPTNLVSKVYDFLNVRGDELATAMDRITTLETKIKAPPTKYTGAGTGGSGTTLQSVTELVAIPKATYDRMAVITFNAVVTDNDGATDIVLRKNQASSIRSIRVRTAPASGAGTYFDLIPANTEVKYQVAAEAANPNGKWTVSDTNQFTSIQVLVQTI